MKTIKLTPVAAKEVQIGEIIVRSKGSVLNLEFLPVKQIKSHKFVGGETIDFVFAGHIGCGVSAEQIVWRLTK